MAFYGMENRLVSDPNPVKFLGSHDKQGVDPSRQRLQFSDSRWKRFPWVGTHLIAEAGNDTGINFVVLQTQKLTLSKSLDPGRIDYAYRVAGGVQVGGKRLAIHTRRLHADVGLIDTVFLQPPGQLGEPFLPLCQDK